MSGIKVAILPENWFRGCLIGEERKRSRRRLKKLTEGYVESGSKEGKP